MMFDGILFDELMCNSLYPVLPPHNWNAIFSRTRASMNVYRLVFNCWYFCLGEYILLKESTFSNETNNAHSLTHSYINVIMSYLFASTPTME